MPARKIILRVSKFLAKGILGVLLLLLITICLIHLPIIQRRISPWVAHYLSEKFQSPVGIERIKFSVFGNIQIENILVSDASNRKILSADKIEVTSNLLNALAGRFTFDNILIAGVDGQLTERSDGWNIQPIIDAFQSKEQNQPTSNEMHINFEKILLKDAVISYTSEINGLAFIFDVGTFNIQDAEVSVHPDRISVTKLYLENSVVKGLSTGQKNPKAISVSSQDKLSLDLGIGMVLDIRDIELKNNQFSFHENFQKRTAKFDPFHLDLEEINLNLANILVDEDTIAANLKNVSVQLPGFKFESKADLQLNRSQIKLSNIHLTTHSSELTADINGRYDLTSGDDTDTSSLHIAAMGRIKPTELSYFLNDSLMNNLLHWGDISLGVEGDFSMRKTEIAKLSLTTKESHLHAKGILHDLLKPEKMYWKDLLIDASMGSDFASVIDSILSGVNVPRSLRFKLKSSGHFENVYLQGNLLTSWGNVTATGYTALRGEHAKIDMSFRGEGVDVGKFLDLPWVGLTNLSMKAKGTISRNPNIQIQGLIDNIKLDDQPIKNIDFKTNLTNSKATSVLSVNDPRYRSEIMSEISFANSLVITTSFYPEHFKLGKVLRMDSTLSLSGAFESSITIDNSSVQGFVDGKNIRLANFSTEYLQDSIALDLKISPTDSRFSYYDNVTNGGLTANFDIRDLLQIVQEWGVNILSPPNITYPSGNRLASINFQMEEATPLRLFGFNIEELSSVKITGEFDEQKQAAAFTAGSGRFKGYGVTLDTLSTKLFAHRNSAIANVNATNLYFNSNRLGNLDVDMHTEGDTAITTFAVGNDSTLIFGFGSRILRSDSGVLVYPDKLHAFKNDYVVDRKNPVRIMHNNIKLDHFLVSRDDMQIGLNGDLTAFDVNINNLDLTTLNQLLSPDSAIINSGHLNARIAYTIAQQLDLTADVDSLRLYNSAPITVAVKAVGDKTRVPFEFLLSNSFNKIDINGQYDQGTREVDASMVIDLDDLEIFTFLASGIFDNMNGAVKGEAQIRGPLQNPRLDGSLRFLDAGFTTTNPKFTFKVQDSRIELNNSALLLKNFTINDPDDNPLVINGQITTPDYQSFNYDLHLQTEKYTIINNADSANSRLAGLLVIGTDIELSGNDKDTNVKANITIKDTTALTVIQSNDEIKLLDSEGIIDFIDPLLIGDSVGPSQSSYFYDSLIASLPDFKLNSTVTIEENARLRIIIDALSGDFIETSGGATLDLGYDRTGHLSLSGNYSIKEGLYRVSFYDLVKKDFKLLPGSSINWSGRPENGNLDINALYTVKSSSIGLIGNEISENEKSIYKRALPYNIGINIKGTIEKPEISFTLDLPPNDKANYPVLANKLERLKQPEYQSELNKQVFALLVLGGFLPEASGTDINENAIATTALYNSVNSLLSSQLNRFASQYIKGVDIDVGIQSYSDYAAGGKTQTAMDFRVTKRVMDDRLSFEIGGDFNINQDQSGSNSGDNFRGDIAIVYDLTEQGNKKLKLFNNETYDIIYQEIRNTGISLIFIREFDRTRKPKHRDK